MLKNKEMPYQMYFSSLKDPRFYPSKWFHSIIDVEFENLKFPIVEEYDDYLTQTYGDYMKIPESHERIDHGDIIVDLEQSYQKYRSTNR